MNNKHLGLFLLPAVLLGGCTISGAGKPELISSTAAESLLRSALQEQREELAHHHAAMEEQRIKLETAPEIKVSLSMLADKSVNSRANATPGVKDRMHAGTPISVKILQLTDDSLLISSDLESLNINLGETLGKTYLDHSDYILTPGQFKFVDFEKIDESTRYIGVIADYRDVGRATWKQVVRLDDGVKKQSLFVRLKSQAVELKVEK